jgi:biofilm PGA synthesis lipoprotein PgaB
MTGSRTMLFQADRKWIPPRRRCLSAGRLRLLALLLPAMLCGACALPLVGPGQDVGRPGPAASPEPLLAVQVDLDYVYDPDTRQEQRNLRLLLARLARLGVNTVFLQAFADPDGNDGADALYFPNRHLPMRRDLFARTARAIRAQGIRVYAWMPLLAFDLGAARRDLLVSQMGPNRTDPGRAPRLSPFHPRARRIIREIYDDLAGHASFDGILFHDDSVLSDFEDASPAALAAYRHAGFPADLAALRSRPGLMRRWSRFKTRFVIDFTLSLVDMMRLRHPALRSARAIYGRAVLQPESEQWLCQSLPLFLQAYDYSVILAMPFLEQVADPDRWLGNLAERALFQALHSPALVFELQSVDWRNKKRVPTEVMRQQLALLRHRGVTSLAWYPDDFFHDQPKASLFRENSGQQSGSQAGGRF